MIMGLSAAVAARPGPAESGTGRRTPPRRSLRIAGVGGFRVHRLASSAECPFRGERMLGAGTCVRLQAADGYSTARRHRGRSRRRTIRGAGGPRQA